MPLVLVLRLLGSLISLAILAGGAYLGWRWYEGEQVIMPDGAIAIVRDDWMLWTALAVLVVSLLGRFIITPFLGKPDTPATLIKPVHGAGSRLSSPTGADLHLETIGEGAKPTLLFTHGWGLDSTIWTYAKRDLSRQFNLVVWDLPGTGKSRPGPDRALGPDRFSTDLSPVIDSIKSDTIILVGHSIGGMTIQSFLRRVSSHQKKRIAGIVLFNTTYTNPLETMIASGLFKAMRWPVLEPMFLMTRLLQPVVWLDAWRNYLSGWAHVVNRIQFGKTFTRSQLDAVTLLGTRNAPGTLARGNQGMFRWDATGATDTVWCPVLVIGGEKDIVTKPQASRDIASMTPSARLMLVDGVNHNGFLEKHEVYNTALAEFAKAAVALHHDDRTGASGPFTGDDAEFALPRSADPSDRFNRARYHQSGVVTQQEVVPDRRGAISPL